MRQPLILIIIRTAATALLAALLATRCSGPSMAEDIGVTAATNPVATGAPPGQGVRELRIGLNVVRNERIRTTAEGSTQVIFVDRTSLTIGPNSDITIDQYVYDPGAGGSNLAMRIGRGVLRFIGGEISHNDQIRITTPTATLGIRGGMALVDTTHQKTGVINVYGTTTVTTPSNSVTLSKPGSYVETSGGRISDAIAVPPSLLARLTAQLESKPGQTGGTRPGLVTSENLRDIVSNTGPLSDHSVQQLLQEQLQFIVSIRPQLESISSAGAIEGSGTTSGTGTAQGTGGKGNMCASDHYDCDRDHHHHHHHRHNFDFDRDKGERVPHFGPLDWRFGDIHGSIRGGLGPLGLPGHGLPDSIGPDPAHWGIPRHP
jgi:hypothetical protein